MFVYLKYFYVFEILQNTIKQTSYCLSMQAEEKLQNNDLMHGNEVTYIQQL